MPTSGGSTGEAHVQSDSILRVRLKRQHSVVRGGHCARLSEEMCQEQNKPKRAFTLCLCDLCLMAIAHT